MRERLQQAPQGCTQQQRGLRALWQKLRQQGRTGIPLWFSSHGMDPLDWYHFTDSFQNKVVLDLFFATNPSAQQPCRIGPLDQKNLRPKHFKTADYALIKHFLPWLG